MRQEDRDFGLAIATVCTFVDRGYAAARRLARLGIDFTATINTVSKSAPGFFAAAWAAASAAASLRAPSCTNASLTSAATAETSPLFAADPLRASRCQEASRITSPVATASANRNGA